MYISNKELKRIINHWLDSPLSQNTIVSHITLDIWGYVKQSYVEDQKTLELYTVIAHRYGDEEGHTYLVGSFKTLGEAIAEAIDHRDNRGGKYNCNVYRDSFNGSPTLVFNYSDYENRLMEIRSKE